MISNWVKYKIEDICSITDCKHDTAPVVNYKTDYKMLRTTNIKNGFIDVENVDYVTEETYIKWSARGFLEKGDIILTREAPIGEVGIIKTDDKLFLGQRLLQLKAKKDIVTPEFLHYSLLSPYFQSQIRRSNNTGSIVSNVKIPELKKIEIHLPSIEVQKQISKILENLDNKIFVNNQINKELEEISKTLYDYWFIQFEFPNEKRNPYKSTNGEMIWNEELKRDIPKNWEVKTLGDYLIRNNQKIKDKQDWENEKLIDLANMPSFSMCINEYDYGRKLNSNIYKLNAFDILFGSIRPYLGKAGFSPFDGVVAGTVHSFQVKTMDFYGFCLITLIRKSFFDYAVSRSKGTKMPVIAYDDILNFKVVVPQDEAIIKEFNTIIISYVKQIKLNIEQNNELTELREFLLPMLMNGQITTSEE